MEQYTFYKGDDFVTSNEVNTGAVTNKMLPSGAGYGSKMFCEDVVSMFENKPTVDLKAIKETWEDHVLYKGNKPGEKFVSIGQARRGVEAMAGFFDKLSKSPIKDAILNYNNGDVKESAQTILDWCEYHVKAQSSMEDFADAMGKAIEKLEKDPDFKKPDQTGSGMGKEGVNIPLTAKTMRVKEILPEVRRKYEFAALRSFKYEKSFFPEDDINVKNMESYGEIMRIPKNLLGAEDDEFYCRMATKSFPVLEYERAIPQPKKFVILIDISGSMKEPVGRRGYLRCEYAQATGVALAEQAEQGGNECEVIYFDGHAREPLKGSARELQEKLLKEQFQGGGTSFESAFRMAEKTKADSVVIVTDGEGSYVHAPRNMPLMTLIAGGRGSEQLRADSYRYEVVAK